MVRWRQRLLRWYWTLIEESISQSSALALKLPCRQFTTGLIKIRHVKVPLQMSFANLLCLILSMSSSCTESNVKMMSFCALYWAFLPLNTWSCTTLLLHCCLHVLMLSKQGTPWQLYKRIYLEIARPWLGQNSV